MEMVKANKKQMFISKIQTSKKQKSRQEILRDKNKIESTEDSLVFCIRTVTAYIASLWTGKLISFKTGTKQHIWKIVNENVCTKYKTTHT